MKFKVLISLLLVGCVILFGFIFLIVKVKQQKADNKQLIDEFLSRNDNPPPLIPRTEEIPDEIRQKFAAVPEIPEKPTIIAELVQGGYPQTVEFSPTNPYLVVSSTYDANAEDTIRLWNINNPITPLAVFSGDSASFSPDGKILAICDSSNYIDGSVKLWDIAKEQFMSALHEVALDAVFSPDHKLLALESSGLELWNVSNPTAPVEAINLKRKNIEKEHTFSADGKLMATVEAINDTVNIWEISGNQVTKKNAIDVIDEKVGWIEAMQFLPDPKNPILAIADHDEDIRLYYPPDWKPNYNTIPAGNVNDLAFTPDGKTIISGGTNELEIWSVENGSRIASIEGYSDWVNCVDVSADGKFVTAGGNDGVIRVWDIANYLPKKQETTQNIVVPIYFLPTNRLPQTDIPEKIDKILRELQTFFADEIQRHGFGRKTFDFEKNSDGSAKVYLFEGKTTDEYYDEWPSSRVLNEIEQHFELSNNCYFIIVDEIIENESIKNRYTFSYSDLENIRESIQAMGRDFIFRQQGAHIVVRTPLNRYAKHVLAAKFGDAFGLNRDYRHPSYLMSYGRQSKHLSKSSAAWLNSSRFFNTEMTFFDDKTIIKTRSPSKGKVRFKVEDADGIYQVRLLAESINENHPPGFQMKIDPVENQTEWEKLYKGRYYTLHDALTLQGEKKAIVELDYPKFANNLIELHVIDGHGNRVYVIKRINNSVTSFLRRILN